MAFDLHIMRDVAGNLKPATPEAQAAVYEMKIGKTYTAEVRLKRNLHRLNWWWKLCNIVADNSERYPTKDHVSDMLKLKCGHFRTVVVPGKEDGEWVQQYTPKSINFKSMEEPDFKKLCDAAVRISAEVLACQSDELEMALNEFFERKAA